MLVSSLPTAVLSRHLKNLSLVRLAGPRRSILGNYTATFYARPLSACLTLGLTRRLRLCVLGLVRLPKMLWKKGIMEIVGDCLKIADELRIARKALNFWWDAKQHHHRISMCSVIAKRHSYVFPSSIQKQSWRSSGWMKGSLFMGKFQTELESFIIKSHHHRKPRNSVVTQLEFDR